MPGGACLAQPASPPSRTHYSTPAGRKRTPGLAGCARHAPTQMGDHCNTLHIALSKIRVERSFVEYIPIERAADAFQQPVEQSHLIAMCQQAFGEEVQIESVKELAGGLYNTTYLVRIVGMPPVVLRVSPHPNRQLRMDKNLMHNEYASLPFLAPIAPLLPRILMVDFTHQILERDYMFQSFMEGEQWAQVMHTFTATENRNLFRQLGSITRKIHSVRGHHFGSTVIDARFSSWSLAVIDSLANMIRDLEEVQLDAAD